MRTNTTIITPAPLYRASTEGRSARRRWWMVGLIAVLVTACGGGGASEPAAAHTTGSESTAAADAAPIGVCFSATLGACQAYYADGTESEGAEARCAETQGTWSSECPVDGRMGDCLDASGRLLARVYVGGAFYADAASARTSCEGEGGTFAE